MLSVSVDFTEFWHSVRQTEDAIQIGIHAGTRRAAEAGVAEAKRAPFKDKTGNLRRYLIAELLGSTSSGCEWVINSQMPYTRFVEDPTRPHDIWPKAAYGTPARSLKPGQTRRGRGKGPHEHVVGRGIALRWKDEGGGQHFARMVHHPGTAGFKFMAMAKIIAALTLRHELEMTVHSLQRFWN